MKHIYKNLDNIIKSSSSEKKYIILDVDRTMMNGTAWFRACSTNDLLLKKHEVGNFLELNRKAYVEKSIPLSLFRKKTLDMISSEFRSNTLDNTTNFRNFSKVKNESLKSKSLKTEELPFYHAGQITISKMKVYEAAIKYIKLLYKNFSGSLEIIFLSSGYYPFMLGVVEEIMEKQFSEKIKYHLIASRIKINNDRIKEIFHINQFIKQEIVEFLINNSINIILLADDSSENPDLFKIIEDVGGKSLKIDYKRGQKVSKVWEKALFEYEKETLTSYYMKEHESLKIKEVNLNNDLLLFLENKINKIGIVNLDEHEYEKGVKGLTKHLSEACSSKAKLDLNELFEIKNNEVILRSKYYYYWVPEYVFPGFGSLTHRFIKLIQHTERILRTLFNRNSMMNLSKNELCSYVILLSLLDHLQHIFLTLINMVEKMELSKDTHKDYFNIYDFNQRINILIVKILENKMEYHDNYEIIDILSTIDWNALQELFIDNLEYHQGMRELDNLLSIYKSAKNILEESNNNLPDYIVSFAYGGISLGYMLSSYIQVNLPEKTSPAVINCHYSSKKILRNKEKSNNNLDYYIPKKYRSILTCANREGRNILLYDNNATTLFTVKEAKSFFERYNYKVSIAVVGFNYKNLVNYTLNYHNFEIMAPEWEGILDYSIIEEYTTSFDTWGTNEKAKLLEDIFLRKFNLPNHASPIREGKIFKLCRVHNERDYKSSISNGVNMLGIHAVYKDFKNYEKSEKENLPKETPYRRYTENLPISDYEVESIAHLQSILDDRVGIALVIEESLSPEQVMDCVKLYKIKICKMSLQLQYRVKENEIKSFKDYFRCNIICAVGINQKDFEEYFLYLNSILNPSTDKILIDFSNHQPDIITGKEIMIEGNKLETLKSLIPVLKCGEIPILLADDTRIVNMKKYIQTLSEHSIEVAGIDMQNAVEYEKKDQRYQYLELKNNMKHQIKIRKSPTKLKEWRDFVYNELR